MIEQEKGEALKNRLDRLYSCRDLEISNLWQRSVFLSVFLTLCFTGYGILIFEMAKIDICSEDCKPFHLLAAALSIVACVFSIIWIFMAKSSKAWYEVYETAISSFEQNNKKILGIPKNVCMGKISIPPKKIDNCLFSMKAGAYSPSKINILIGQACFVIWIFATLFHLSFYFSIFYNEGICWYVLLVTILIGFIVLMIWIIGGWVRSGHLFMKKEHLLKKKRKG